MVCIRIDNTELSAKKKKSVSETKIEKDVTVTLLPHLINSSRFILYIVFCSPKTYLYLCIDARKINV